MAQDPLSLDFGSDKPFYVYVYRDPRPRKRRVPIYVGKGTVAHGRADFHWQVRARNPLLAAIFRKIKNAGLVPGVEIVAWFDDEAAASRLETRLIKQFGRRDLKTGTLANLTDGGEGNAGRIDTAETTAKKAAAAAARFERPGELERLASLQRGVTQTAEHREKKAAALRGRKHSEETKAKMRIARAARAPASADTRAKMSEIAKARTFSAETRAKMSAAHAARPPASDETRAKLSQSNLGLKRSAETKARISLAKQNLSPETRQRMKDARHKQVRRPHSQETRKKMRVAAIKAWAVRKT